MSSCEQRRRRARARSRGARARSKRVSTPRPTRSAIGSPVERAPRRELELVGGDHAERGHDVLAEQLVLVVAPDHDDVGGELVELGADLRSHPATSAARCSAAASRRSRSNSSRMPVGPALALLDRVGDASGRRSANCSARSISSSGQPSGGKWVRPSPSSSPIAAAQSEHPPGVAGEHLPPGRRGRGARSGRGSGRGCGASCCRRGGSRTRPSRCRRRSRRSSVAPWRSSMKHPNTWSRNSSLGRTSTEPRLNSPASTEPIPVRPKPVPVLSRGA